MVFSWAPCLTRDLRIVLSPSYNDIVWGTHDSVQYDNKQRITQTMEHTVNPNTYSDLFELNLCLKHCFHVEVLTGSWPVCCNSKKCCWLPNALHFRFKILLTSLWYSDPQNIHALTLQSLCKLLTAHLSRVELNISDLWDVQSGGSKTGGKHDKQTRQNFNITKKTICM